MRTIDLYSDEELKAELGRRKNEKLPKPLLVYNPDLVETRCIEYIDKMEEFGGYGDYSVEKELIFESAIEMIYGDKIFDWMNKHYE